MADRPTLLVMVPTRGRRERCETLLASFRDTTDNADLLFITDEDDQDTYAGMDWGGAEHAVSSPKGTLSEILNRTAMACADAYDVLMFTGDDHVFATPHWDTIMLATLGEMGGHGWVYPDDKRRHDVPEIWMCTSDVVKTLGWFSPPAMAHFYIDNGIGEIAKRAGLIRWCPEAVIEHQHYSTHPDVEHDATYRDAEAAHGQPDLAAFEEWRSLVLPNEVALLRRQYNPDVAWVLSRAA